MLEPCRYCPAPAAWSLEPDVEYHCDWCEEHAPTPFAACDEHAATALRELLAAGNGPALLVTAFEPADPPELIRDVVTGIVHRLSELGTYEPLDPTEYREVGPQL